MKVAIHQPHYFPWLGYYDKMAKVDRFVIMDMVQFVPRSYMCRNSFVARGGGLEYLTVTASKHAYQEKVIREIETVDCHEWQNKHTVFLTSNYKYFPHFAEVMNGIEPVFSGNFDLLFDVLTLSMRCIANMLGVTTEIVLQSTLHLEGLVERNQEQMDKNVRRGNDVIELCEVAGADRYITGRGKSLEFVDADMFKAHQIGLAYQEYTCPIYEQKFTKDFIPNISALDMLFNCGIEESREMFWNNVHSTHEFD